MVELIWDGKYDKDGNRAAPLRVKLPFQTVETVSESVQQRQMSLDFGSRQTQWRNRLIWGDKKYVLPSLLEEFAGKVDLIYIDPPFDTGANFSFQLEIQDESFTKEPSIIEHKAYRDIWGKGVNSYIHWFFETSVILHELLAPSGSIYVHCDWRVNSLVRLCLDEIFGSSNFVNEITWAYFAFKRSTANKFPQKHDTILSYRKDKDNFTWHTQYKPHSEEYLKRWKKDANGRLYRDDVNPTKGGTRVIYLDEIPGDIVDSVWDDIPPVNPVAKERVNYPTQKPEGLLSRIIEASTDNGQLVLDCFCGSGTTAAVAEKLGRRWLACDLGRFAVHTTRKRLLSIPDVKPFVVQNLGKYERQTWQSAEFGSKKRAEALQKDYRNFLLELYSARPIEGYAWLHGIKGGRMVHVGSVDSPVALGDITQIAIEFKKAIGTGKDAPKEAAVDVLGWDFAFEINEVGIQQARDAGINLRCLKIPREVMDPKAVEQGDVKFFELAALAVDTKAKKNELFLELKDFTIPPDDVPDDVQKAIKHWSQWIDYWAVDWDNKADTFHNQWQAYRTRQEPSLKLKTSHVYEEPGAYTVMVKVIDILGNDTTKVIKVNI